MKIFISSIRTSFEYILGGETFLLGLLQGLHRDARGHEVCVAGGERLITWIRENTPSINHIKVPIAGHLIQRLWSERRLAPRYAAEFGADIAFFPFNLLPNMPMKSVVFIHDLNSLFYRKKFPFSRFFKAPAKLWQLRISSRRADLVLSGTQETCRQIIETGWIPASKVKCVNDAVPAASKEVAKPASVQLSSNDFLVLLTGANYRHKDRATAVRGFRRLLSLQPQTTKNMKMIIVGSDDDSDIRAELCRSELDGSVLNLGYVNSAELEWLMQRADTMVFPTHYEGFGLSVLEAQMRGVPIVASDIPVVREVSGSAALFFEPGDHDALAGHVLNLAADSEIGNNLKKLGRENAAKYSVERMAGELLDVFEELAGT